MVRSLDLRLPSGMPVHLNGGFRQDRPLYLLQDGISTGGNRAIGLDSLGHVPVGNGVLHVGALEHQVLELYLAKGQRLAQLAQVGPTSHLHGEGPGLIGPLLPFRCAAHPIGDVVGDNGP